MGIHQLSPSIPSLPSPCSPFKMSLRDLWNGFFVVAVLCAISCRTSFGYTAVILSTGVPESIETNFIQATTTQFSVNLSTNPFFPNTYQIKLNGINPNYNPPPTNAQLMNTIVTISTGNYVYGWADGTSGQLNKDINTAGGVFVECSSPTATDFNIGYPTTTWDINTCRDVASTIFLIMRLQQGTTSQ